MSPAMEAQIPNHWTAREFPELFTFKWLMLTLCCMNFTSIKNILNTHTHAHPEQLSPPLLWGGESSASPGTLCGNCHLASPPGRGSLFSAENHVVLPSYNCKKGNSYFLTEALLRAGPVLDTGNCFHQPSFFFFFSIWLHRVLVVARGIFVAACGILHCGVRASL